MHQYLVDVYENVIDRSATTATGLSWAEASANRDRIQEAIDSGRHLLFPAGTYTFAGTLEFDKREQRSTFLAGAILQPFNSRSHVRITGVNQTIIGMRIEAPEELEAHSPLVDIYRAAGLQMQELRVSVTLMDASVAGSNASVPGPRAAVRVMCLTKCKFIGGMISGNGEAGTIGLWLASSYDYDSRAPASAGRKPALWKPGEWSNPPPGTNAQIGTGAYEVGAIGLTVKAFGWGVRIGCITDDPSFVRCIFTNNVDGALIVRDDADMVPKAVEHISGERPPPGLSGGGAVGTARRLRPYYQTLTVAKALTIIGCHMDGAMASQYVHVQSGELGDDGVVYGGGMIAGGAILGCTFGDRTLDGAPDVVTQVPAPGAIVPRAAMRTGVVTGGVVGVGQRRVIEGARSASGRSPGGSNSQSATTRSKGADPGRRAVPIVSKGAFVPGVVETKIGGSDLSRDACIFLIEGLAYGVVVSGCRSEYRQDRGYVWNLGDSGKMTQSCDLFNAWSEPIVATGAHASNVIQMTTDGRLTSVAGALRLKTSKLGFLGADPGEPGGAYTAPTRGIFELHPGNVHLVLASLLDDLINLGLIRRA